MPSEKPSPAGAATGQPDQLEHLVDPRPRDAVGLGQPQQVVAGGAPAGALPGVQQRADLAQRRRQVAVGRPLTVAPPALGASSPRIMRMVVDLPAPFGPRKPVTRPGRTRKLTPVHRHLVAVPLGQPAGLDHGARLEPGPHGGRHPTEPTSG